MANTASADLVIVSGSTITGICRPSIFAKRKFCGIKETICLSQQFKEAVILTQDLQLKPNYFPKQRIPFLAAPNVVGDVPAINGIVVVEGLSDYAAVYKAVCAPIFVYGGAGKNAGFRIKLAQVQERCPNIIVLTDGDAMGRQLRNYLDDGLGPLFHAFIPVKDCIAVQQTKYHEVSNIGVEHASPKAIQRALKNSTRSNANRRHFTRDNLKDWNLLGKASGDEGSFRRAIFCNILGIGNSNGKQLLKQLNQYGFQEQQVKVALHATENRYPLVQQVWQQTCKQHHQSLDVSGIDCEVYIQQILLQQQNAKDKLNKLGRSQTNVEDVQVNLKQLVQNLSGRTLYSDKHC